jgi:hypothetical protein
LDGSVASERDFKRRFRKRAYLRIEKPSSRPLASTFFITWSLSLAEISFALVEDHFQIIALAVIPDFHVFPVASKNRGQSY